MHRPTSPEPAAAGGCGSFTALLGLPTTQAMELLIPVAPTFPSDPSLVDRAARFSAFAASSSSSPPPPPPPAAKRKDPGDRSTNKGKAAKKGRVEAAAAAGGGEDAEEEEEEKPAYVHVRARRGQATDSHSLAERARREKINARMELLKELVPGCSKVSGTALVLDEIINHVQSLQRQVEYLSMRLAAVNGRVDFGGLDSLLATECGRATDLNCKNAVNSEQAIWPELGIYGARQLAQLQQQFWHGDVTHSHQLTLMSDKQDDDHPPVLASSGASLFGYDLASSVAQPQQSKLKTEL